MKPARARKAPEGPVLRRSPQQDRGKQRVEAILDAAEQLFAEVGYDAATTEAIAARAGASIGSLYQFFPNKKALFAALSERYLTRSQELFEGILAGDQVDLPWPELLEVMVDGFYAFHDASPAFRAVWVQGNLTPELVLAGERVNLAFAEHVEALLARHAPDLPTKERVAMSTVVVETASALLWVSARRGGEEAKRIAAETKRILHAYLAERIPKTLGPHPIDPEGPDARRGSLADQQAHADGGAGRGEVGRGHDAERRRSRTPLGARARRAG